VIAARLVERLRSAHRARVELLQLPMNGTLRIVSGRDGVTVRCDAGTILVTQEGDLVDHVLHPQDELRTSGRGLVVAWALSDAALTVARRLPARPARARSQGGRAPKSPGAQPSIASR
jgi:hypothetical protein